jgi:hypothetical protein
MDNVSRRQLVALGAAGGAAFLAALGRTEAEEAKDRVIVADERAVLFKVKDVTLDGVDEAKRTVAVSFGRTDTPVKLTDLPLAKDVSIRVSLVFPGSVNNVPFDMARLQGLVGKRVSMLLRAEASGLAVNSIAVAND